MGPTLLGHAVRPALGALFPETRRRAVRPEGLMKGYGVCKRCQGRMAILDELMEGYDLICARCGLRELLVRTIAKPQPCYQ